MSDRFCPEHYEPDVRYGFLNFGADLRFGKCRYCAEEEFRAWEDQVRFRLQVGLYNAAHGRKVTWNPLPDEPWELEYRLWIYELMRNCPKNREYLQGFLDDLTAARRQLEGR